MGLGVGGGKGPNCLTQAQLPTSKFNFRKLEVAVQLPTSNFRKLQVELEQANLDPYKRATIHASYDTKPPSRAYIIRAMIQASNDTRKL